MEKKFRIILYAASLAILLAMVVLIVFSRTGKPGKNTVDVLAEQMQTETEEEPGMDEKDRVQDEQMPLEPENEPVPQTEETDDCTTLVFAGDVLFHNMFFNNYDTGGIENIIAPPLLEQLRDADIFMVNNEFAFSSRGTPMEDKQYTFRCPPEYVKVLQEMGVDIVTLANNHALDYGRDALSDTFATLEDAGILYVGAGNTAEQAYKLAVIEKNGMKFGFLAASRVVPVADWKVEVKAPGMLTAYDDTKLVELIGAAKDQCDFLSVYLHWGIERDAYPQEYQTQIAENCFAAGADLVLGAHPHCLQGISYVDGKPLFYSLGNFVFGQNIEKTMVLKVEVSSDGEAVCRIIPAYASGGTTQLMEGDRAAALFTYMTEISDAVKIDAEGRISR